MFESTFHYSLGNGSHLLSVISERFVNFFADPQLVKQYGQLPRYRDHRSFLGIPSPARSKITSPASFKIQ